jgi:4-carboxymuconolactone decarboxylase
MLLLIRPFALLLLFGTMIRLAQSSFFLQRNTTLVYQKNAPRAAKAPFLLVERNKQTTSKVVQEAAAAGTTASEDPTEHDHPCHHVYTAAHLQPRFTGPKDAEMTLEQRDIRDAILASRPRTGLSGPFGPWLAVPTICQPAQQLGRACRYGTSLSFAESELVILFTAAKTKSHAEFDIHVGEALAAGWSHEWIASIPRDDAFSSAAIEQFVVPLLSDDDEDNDKNNTSNARHRAIARFTAELLDTYTVSDDTYRTTKEILGHDDAVLVEITSIVGYYTLVALTLNVFQIPSK